MIAPDTTPLGSLDDDRAAALAAAEEAGRVDDAFRARLDAHLPRLHAALAQLLAGRPDGRRVLAHVIAQACAAWSARPLDLKVHDARRLAHPERLSSERMLGGACYADRYGGNLAGIRDHVPYFRELGLTLLHLMPLFETDGADAAGRPRVDPSVGSIPRLADLAADLHLAGIALMLDVPLASDLDATEDDAVAAAVDRVLFVANLGVDVLGVDPDDLGDDAHPMLQTLSAALALAAPAAALAAVHGSTEHLSPDECRLATDPLPGVLTWEALATRDARMLQRALDRRPAAPSGTTLLTSVRDADALRWAFPDADAVELGADPLGHRGFLTDFYTGDFEGGFGRGIRFSSDGADDGVAGTTASLAGIEAGDPGGEDRALLAHAIALSTGGVPVLWLGDEVAQLNDPTYTDDPDRRDDARWAHRGQRPRDRYADRHDPETVAGRVHRRMTKLLSARRSTPEFAGGAIVPFHTPQLNVVGYQRPGAETTVLVLANVGDEEVTIDPLTLSGFERSARDIVRDSDVDLDDGLTLAPLGFTWLRVTPV